MLGIVTVMGIVYFAFIVGTIINKLRNPFKPDKYEFEFKKRNKGKFVNRFLGVFYKDKD